MGGQPPRPELLGTSDAYRHTPLADPRYNLLLEGIFEMQDLRVLQKADALHEARWWELEPSGKVHCYLCPRHCHIGEGQAGFCFIRAAEGGKLYSLGYAHPAALQIDPIEKKPLNHFLPGSRVFSMGTAGCNMGCFFCQNWDISKSRSDQVHSSHLPPEDVVRLAIRNGCPTIAFTYNEPTIWGEYVIDICHAARESGLNTVMVSNGYITYDAFHDIYDQVDAANIDLKAFSENFYGRVTLTHLQPVLETLQWLRRETSVWFEITNLLIPTLNDSPAETRQLAEWILEHLGPDVPLHFTAFHPDFKLRDKPRTPPETLHVARATALEVGLHYVYEGNIYSNGAHTSCPSCGTLLIRRSWHDVLENHVKQGCCPNCALAVPGRWSNPRGQTSPKAAQRACNIATSEYDHLNL
jgi:pyruvate formate lyase activating enzyme